MLANISRLNVSKREAAIHNTDESKKNKLGMSQGWRVAQQETHLVPDHPLPQYLAVGGKVQLAGLHRGHQHLQAVEAKE